jgi:hypothetical protein
MPKPTIPIQTVQYKTYVKEALVEALRNAFTGHPDELLAKVNIGIDYSLEELDYPQIVVRFYERSIKNAGVGHQEWFETAEGTGRYVRFKHMLYTGDIEFAVYALSSYDRDLISDSIVQILTMGDIEPYTNAFLERIYSPNPTTEPVSIEHFINLNTDEIMGFGETQTPAPWGPEDVLVYQTAYRIGIFGEFYSRMPEPQPDYGLVERVDSFPYPADEEAPDPGWRGPDGVYGTADDQPDDNPWEG